jgi:hypothetical protein
LPRALGTALDMEMDSTRIDASVDAVIESPTRDDLARQYYEYCFLRAEVERLSVKALNAGVAVRGSPPHRQFKYDV